MWEAFFAPSPKTGQETELAKLSWEKWRQFARTKMHPADGVLSWERGYFAFSVPLLPGRAKAGCSALCWNSLCFSPSEFGKHFFFFFFNMKVLPIQQSHLKFHFRWCVLFLLCDVQNWGGPLKYFSMKRSNIIEAWHRRGCLVGKGCLQPALQGEAAPLLCFSGGERWGFFCICAFFWWPRMLA